MSQYQEYDISEGEEESLSEYFNDRQKFATLHRHKLLFFHTNPDGSPKDLKPETLFNLFSQGYTFVTCYPKRSKLFLRFGNYIFPKHDGIVATKRNSGNCKILILCGYYS